MIFVYRCGLQPPTQGADLVREQMRLAHAYRNTLTEIERARRKMLRSLGGEEEIALLAAHAATDEVCRGIAVEIKAYKSRERTRKVPPEMSERMKVAKEARKKAARDVFDFRRQRATDPAVAAAVDEVNEAASLARQVARRTCGVFWGSYLPVEAAERASRAKPLYDGVAPDDPEFVRWTGEGTVAVQLQGGLSVADLQSGEDTRLRLRLAAWGSPETVSDEPPPGWGSRRYTPEERRARWRHMLAHGGAHDGTHPGQKGPRPMGTLELRVGSANAKGERCAGGHTPVWAAWPVPPTRRSLPPDAIVKWAHVHVRRIAAREEWSLTLTIECARRESCGTGAVAVDLGWRRMEDGGLRVAVAQGDDGKVHEMRLSPCDIDQLTKADSIRSHRDMLFDLARPWLRAILDALPERPAWLDERLASMALWRAQARLAAVAIHWRSHRFDGDADAFAAIEAWRRRDKHLWSYEDHQRKGSLRRRRDLYRTWAAKLARQYGVLVLEDGGAKGETPVFDLRAFATLPEVEEVETERDERARSQRHLAAPSELRLALTQAFEGRGGQQRSVVMENSTRRCAVEGCDAVESWDAGAELRHTCKNGHTWDQDENAGANMLRLYRENRERPHDASARTTARKKEKKGKVKKDGIEGESAYARGRRLRAERQARIAAARKTSQEATGG